MALKHYRGRCQIRLLAKPIMDQSLSLAILVFMLVTGIWANPQLDEDRCEVIVRSWAENELRSPQNFPKLKLRDLLFFLHIPRTGGRTFHQCFLKLLFESDERCPRSYDKLRFDTSRPGCRLISTHDDYSFLQKLPEGKASVITNLRDPVGRVLSSYEFSVEVAARFLRQYKSRTNFRRPGTTKTGTKLVSTLDIWPWKYLVPFMQRDVFARRDAREGGQLKYNVDVPFRNSYDSVSLVMPFDEFIHHPIAHELVHNGATFQVAGLTNNSYVENGKEIRACVVDYQHLGHWVLDVAKRRLDNMLYVGLTDHQEESVTFFSHVLRGQLSMQHIVRNPQKANSRTMLNDPHVLPFQRQEASADGKRRYSTHTLQVPDLNNTSESMIEDVISELLESYRGCVKDLRYAQENRRAVSLELIAPINFTKKERKFIPEGVIDQVRQLNNLDLELYSHAQLLFAKQQDALEHGLHDEMLEAHGVQDKLLQGLSEQMKIAEQQDKLLYGSSEQMNIAEQHESSWQSIRQPLSIYISGVTISVTLFGLVVFIHVLRKKFLGEGTAIRVLHPLFVKVHEKI